MNRRALITGATGDTGRAAVKELVALGLNVRVMVHGKDDRSAALERLGVEGARRICLDTRMRCIQLDRRAGLLPSITERPIWACSAEGNCRVEGQLA
jgi:NAD(P)-dependent dehydrogenase (short-subunit alcohol dehydrogenase family)